MTNPEAQDHGPATEFDWDKAIASLQHMCTQLDANERRNR